jgi:hypothetical protein
MSKPFYILAIAPTISCKLKKIFEPGSDSIMHLLQNPGKLRPSGWDLVTYDIPQIVKGEFLEVKNYQKDIRVYEDGALILKALADNNYLSWGQHEEDFKKFPRLNPIALIELTYNFIDFYKKLSRHFEITPKNIKLRCELRNAFLNENAKLCLTPHGVNTVAFSSNFKAEAPENDMIKEIEKELDDLLNYPAQVAYELIEKLYLWFGHTSCDIPYTDEDEQGKKFIDINQIKKMQ